MHEGRGRKCNLPYPDPDACRHQKETRDPRQWYGGRSDARGFALAAPSGLDRCGPFCPKIEAGAKSGLPLSKNASFASLRSWRVGLTASTSVRSCRAGSSIAGARLGGEQARESCPERAGPSESGTPFATFDRKHRLGLSHSVGRTRKRSAWPRKKETRSTRQIGYADRRREVLPLGIPSSSSHRLQRSPTDASQSNDDGVDDPTSDARSAKFLARGCFVVSHAMAPPLSMQVCETCRRLTARLRDGRESDEVGAWQWRDGNAMGPCRPSCAVH